jgi:hypothetical protein
VQRLHTVDVDLPVAGGDGDAVEVGEDEENFRIKIGGGNDSRLVFEYGSEMRDFGVELDRRSSELDFDFLRKPESL